MRRYGVIALKTERGEHLLEKKGCLESADPANPSLKNTRAVLGWSKCEYSTWSLLSNKDKLLFTLKDSWNFCTCFKRWKESKWGKAVCLDQCRNIGSKPWGEREDVVNAMRFKKKACQKRNGLAYVGYLTELQSSGQSVSWHVIERHLTVVWATDYPIQRPTMQTCAGQDTRWRG